MVGIALGTFFIYQIIMLFLDWFNFKYSVTSKGVYILSGRMIVNKVFVPIDNIQGIHQKTNVITRFLNLTSINLDIGTSSEDSNVKIDYITIKEAEKISNALKLERKTSIESLDCEDENEYKYELNKLKIVIFSILSLEFLIIIPIIQWLKNSRISEYLSLDVFFNEMAAKYQESTLYPFVYPIILIIFSIMCGILKYYFQYGNFKVHSKDKYIYFIQGFLNKNETAISKNKIHAIILQQNFLQRIFDLCKIKIISMKSHNDMESRTRNVLFPIINNEYGLKVLSKILPSFIIHKSMKPIPKITILPKLTRTSYIWALSNILIYVFFKSYWYFGVVVFVIVLLSQIISALFSKYLFHERFVQFQSAGISNKLFVTSHDNIEELKVTQSFIQKLFGVSTLHIYIQSKPIYHFQMKDIPQKDIEEYCNLYKSYNKLI